MDTRWLAMQTQLEVLALGKIHFLQIWKVGQDQLTRLQADNNDMMSKQYFTRSNVSG